MRLEKLLKFEGGIYDSVKHWPRRWAKNRQWRKSQDNRRCRRTERQMVNAGIAEVEHERSEPRGKQDQILAHIFLIYVNERLFVRSR